MRTRVDGRKLEQEIVREASKTPFPVFVIRLHTPQSQQANVRNIADFILLGSRATLLEVKETGEKSFSLNTFQQKEQIEKFKEFFTRAQNFYKDDWKWHGYPYRVAILIHFIKYNKYTLYYLDEGPFKVIHATDEGYITASSLQEILKIICTE